MSVIVTIPQSDSWQVSNPAFRMLAKTADRYLEVHQRDLLGRAQASGVLSLENLEPEAAQQVALGLQAAAEDLRVRLRESPDAWDQSLADALDDLSVRLTKLAQTEF